MIIVKNKFFNYLEKKNIKQAKLRLQNEAYFHILIMLREFG